MLFDINFLHVMVKSCLTFEQQDILNRFSKFLILLQIFIFLFLQYKYLFLVSVWGPGSQNLRYGLPRRRFFPRYSCLPAGACLLGWLASRVPPFSLSEGDRELSVVVNTIYPLCIILEILALFSWGSFHFRLGNQKRQ